MNQPVLHPPRWVLAGAATAAPAAAFPPLLPMQPETSTAAPAIPIAAVAAVPVAAAPAADGKLRIIAFGAHPDDCELRVGGAGAKWAALGHHVKFVSVTNGDIGHWGSAGGPL